MAGIGQKIGLAKALGRPLGELPAGSAAGPDPRSGTDGLVGLELALQRLTARISDILSGPEQRDLHRPADLDGPWGPEVASDVLASLLAASTADRGLAASGASPALTGAAGDGGDQIAFGGAAPVGDDASAEVGGYGALGFPGTGTEEGSRPGGAPPAPAPLELLVQFEPGAAAAEIRAAAAALGGRVVETIHTPVMAEAGRGVVVRMTFGQGLSAEQAIDIVSKRPGVVLAEPNWGVSVQLVSNDPSLGDLWGMGAGNGSHAVNAWADGYVGSAAGGKPSTTVVGVIDSGIDYTHPDLCLNIWINQAEITDALVRMGRDRLALDHDGDGQITFHDLNASAIRALNIVTDANGNGRIDAYDLLNSSLADKVDATSDRNGYVDDLCGWDFANNDNNPFDDNNHGTHVAGTIGAIGGNATGVVGVAWDVQLMALKFLNAAGSGTSANAIKAVDYYTAASMYGGVQNFVGTNNSWGGGGFSQLLLDSIVAGANQDSLFIAAAGNGGSDGRGDDNDAVPFYPGSYNTTAAAGYDAVIAVAAINKDGLLASFSNYGATTVELAAPGVGILSTLPGETYGSYNGTSMATPHVAGALALMAAANPTASAEALREALLKSLQESTLFAGKTMTDGQLDVASLLDWPMVTGVVYGDHDGTLKAGETVTLKVLLSQAVTVAGGVPTLSLNAGTKQADYLSGSGSKELVFTYTVQAGDTAADLAVTGLVLNGATIMDQAKRHAILLDVPTNPPGTLRVDTSAPSVTVTASDASLAKEGDTTIITFQFSEAVSGFILGDVTFSGGTLESFVDVDGDTYTVVFKAGAGTGTHSVGVAASAYGDLAGNAGGGGSVQLTLGAAGPSVPSALALAGPDVGPGDTATYDTMPTLTGRADAGATVEVSLDGGVVGTTTAEADGSWTFRSTIRIEEGARSFTAVAIAADGLRSAASDALATTIQHLYGTTGSDAAVRSGFLGLDEVISGLARGSTSLGKGTKDTLWGDGGVDVFVLGDSRGRFYDDGSAKSAGTGDYAAVGDFGSDDAIQLHGAASGYLLRNVSVNGFSGTGIYFDTNGNKAFDTRDELIGHVRGVAASALDVTALGTGSQVVYDPLSG